MPVMTSPLQAATLEVFLCLKRTPTESWQDLSLGRNTVLKSNETSTALHVEILPGNQDKRSLSLFPFQISFRSFLVFIILNSPQLRSFLLLA